MKRRLNLAPALFLAPNFVGFLVFTAGPVLYSFVVSFTNSNLQRTVSTRFIGLQNFLEIAHDEKFWLSFLNTVYLMLGIPISIAVSLWLAILLHRKMKGVSTFKALLFLPSVTSGVAIMILWKALYNPDYGPINSSIEALFHVHGPQWLLSTDNIAGLNVEHIGITHKQLGIGARDALNLMGIWAAIGGSNMLLYLAGLTNIPEELIEAAQVDGASRWATFTGIIWPQLAPTTFFIVIMSIIGGLQGGFETAKVMTNGGPAGTTSTMAFYIFTKAFEEYRIGYASAVSWLLFAMILLFTILNWKFGNKDANLA